VPLAFPESFCQVPSFKVCVSGHDSSSVIAAGGTLICQRPIWNRYLPKARNSHRMVAYVMTFSHVSESRLASPELLAAASCLRQTAPDAQIQPWRQQVRPTVARGMIWHVHRTTDHSSNP
jgi:hypothetical protein